MSSRPPDSGGIGRKQRLLLEVEAFSRRRYRLVFLASLLIVALGGWLGSRLDKQNDVLELIPKGNRTVDTFRDALRRFGSIDYLMVLLEAGEGEGPDELEDFADLLARKLEARSDLVETVEYRLELEGRALNPFSEWAPLFLAPEKLPELARRLSDDAIQRRVGEIRDALRSPAAPLSEELMVQDPLGLLPLLGEQLRSRSEALRFDLSDGYYLSRDGRSLILLVKPARPSQDLDFDARLLDAAGRAGEEVREEIRAERIGGAAVTVRLGGNYAVALEESRLVQQTVKMNLVVSFLAVTALYWLCYRRFAALFYSALPLMVGQAATFAVAYFALGSLNSASSALPALLMGLGTDFTIVMYARYVEERQAGAGLADATEAMVGETGLGVFTGAITSAGTFYAMCVSGFRGLFDLGFLIGTGILLCAVAIVFLMPAMITWNEGVRPRRVDAVRKLHLQSFGLERLIPLSARRPWLVLGGLVAITAASAWLAIRLDFDDSLASLRSQNSRSAEVMEDVSERFGASLSYMMAIAEDRTLEGALARTEAIQDRLRPFKEDRTVGRSESLLDYLPPTSRQEKVIEELRRGEDGPFDPERVRRSFEQALDENGIRREPFAACLGSLGKLLRPERPLTLADLEAQGLGRILERYVHRGPEGVQVVTYLYPTDPRWKRRPPPGLVEALTAGDPQIVVTGTNMVGLELRRLLKHEAAVAVAVGLVLVAILLLADFRSLWLSAVAMAQLLSGVVLMFGLMKLLGMSLNYSNAFVATMIMGVGIDYSIHLVHRLKLDSGRTGEGLLETGKAVVMAALTNVAGFGTLSLGSYPAMQSFGLAALLGSVTCLLTSLTLVPAMMAVRPGWAARSRP